MLVCIIHFDEQMTIKSLDSRAKMRIASSIHIVYPFGEGKAHA